MAPGPVEGGFALPECKADAAWLDRDTLLLSAALGLLLHHRGLTATTEKAARPIILQLRLQPPQRIQLDLPHALARQADFAADLLERERLLSFKAEAKLQYPGIAFIDRVEQAKDGLELLALRDGFIGRFAPEVLEQVSEVDAPAVIVHRTRVCIQP